MEKEMAMKEVYDVVIRTNAPMQIGNIKFDVNEAILGFKTANLVNLTQHKNHTEATGGYGNKDLITWETDKEMSFEMDNGLLTQESWSILSNSKINQIKRKSVNYMEKLKPVVDEDFCYVTLKYLPNGTNERFGAQGNPYNEQLPLGRRLELMLKPLPPNREKFIFCYDMRTGLKIKDFFIQGNRIYFRDYYEEIKVDYTYWYCGDIEILEIGNRLYNGFYNISCKTRTKRYDDGKIETAIIEIPKVKIYSKLNIRLGKQVEYSTVSDFHFSGLPEENVRHEKESTCKISFLGGEI